ncbi:MAG: prepilin-type N-terminal cleavage/methylation domain-containing protein, partial [Candidatus Gracilibacteria bacterium]|nr:prepilin-type N-terminal cleavage/methylation domain-containing protein [Candidatus Gracilibacteria bacterium]
MNKKAFTLVELIVVITILSVLATVAFISFQGYGIGARDSVRLHDMKSMAKVLGHYHLTENRYPDPVGATTIEYQTNTAWYQGTFGNTAFTKNTSIPEIPKDPATDSLYTYSIVQNKQSYQLGGILEGAVSHSILPQTYAGENIGQAYIKGNYNGKVLAVFSGSTVNILGIPSIVASDISN